MKSLLCRVLIPLCPLLFGGTHLAAQSVDVVDTFDPGGSGGYSYANGQIGDFWGNWFGGALDSITWDSSSDASNNPDSGSMKIVASFSLNDYGQYELFNGLSAFDLSALQYTNLQFDIRFAAASVLSTNGNGSTDFGFMQIGTRTSNDQQDYFYGLAIPSKNSQGQPNTNWIHVNIPLNLATDTNLLFVPDVLFHTINTYYGNTFNGTQTFWLDNIQFTGPSPALTGTCSVDWTNVFQRIDGFGASSAWNSGITPALADMFFSTNTGVGLSLLRSRIAPDGTTVESSAMQLAQARGARVWSTPWSPPASLKGPNASGVQSINGGPLIGNPANYQAYASQLAGYVANMKNTCGVNIYAVSVQNEPDTDTTNYESCTWTAQQFHDFIPYLSATLAASNAASTKILFPESYTWAGHLYFQQTAMNDPAVAPLVGIIADHNYDGANFDTGDMNPAAAINNYGNALWETEVSTGDAYNGSITNALYWAGRIHQFMTVAQANAWHYWWLTPTGPDNEALTDTSGNPAKRMYALGNFSRFVRPNFYRIGVDTNSGPLQISAYKEPLGGQIAIVAINPSATAITQVFNLSGFTATHLIPWITSATQSLASLSAVAVAGNIFTNMIPAQSIVTFVGASTSGNLPPELAPVAAASVGADLTLTLTNSATDPNLPPPTLTFSLLAGPTNATLNNSNGVFVWTPMVGQANSTNLVTVAVSDTSTPALIATNSFIVTVLPLAAPVITSINPNGSQWVFSTTGALGPNYTLSTSTDLSNWRPLLTTNPIGMPLTITITNDLQPQRFYRLQLGP